MAICVYGQVPKAKKTSVPARVARRRSHHRRNTSGFGIIELSDDADLGRLEKLDFPVHEEEEKEETFTMVFVILKLEGPLFSIGFADISGLTAGVGVNTLLRLPTVETMLDFPFTKPSAVTINQTDQVLFYTQDDDHPTKRSPKR
jgi:hypothetical protein